MRFDGTVERTLNAIDPMKRQSLWKLSLNISEHIEASRYRKAPLIVACPLPTPLRTLNFVPMTWQQKYAQEDHPPAEEAVADVQSGQAVTVGMLDGMPPSVCTALRIARRS